MRLPEAAEGGEPRVGFRERRRVDRVEAAGAVGSHGREARLAEHAEVLGDGGLRDAELLMHDATEVARRGLALGEQLEEPSADRISEDVERVHALSTSGFAYISQVF